MNTLHEDLAEEALCSLGGVLYLDLLETSTLHSRLIEACRDAAACPAKEAAEVLAELVGITQAVAAHARYTRRLLRTLTDTQAVLRGSPKATLRPLPDVHSDHGQREEPEGVHAGSGGARSGATWVSTPSEN